MVIIMKNTAIKNAKWIHPNKPEVDCPIFKKNFELKGKIKNAILEISAKGVFTAFVNGRRASDDILAPGSTQYDKRILWCTYDITELLEDSNELTIETSRGWFSGRISSKSKDLIEPVQIIAAITLNYESGKTEFVTTSCDWEWAEGPMKFCDIYDGVVYDANIEPQFNTTTIELSERYDTSILYPQDGEKVKAHERIKPKELIITPKGEKVLDFGQNLVGTVSVTLNAESGDKVELSFAEILDKDGNFYNKNYRSAKCLYDYTCKNGEQTFEPLHTFYGFRFVRVDKFPSEFSPEQFTAVVIHSDMKRTGYIETSNPMLNQLFSNVIWGQKGNYLDIPTDCPQRDERQGWTGDAQVFCKTASYNFDVEKFFTKWLRDVVAAQGENGVITKVVPCPISWGLEPRAGWGDAIAICPWQMYLTYGNTEILKETFPSIKRWISCIGEITKDEFLWTGCRQYGDWLELAAPYGAYKGETSDDIVASAFYANTVSLACKIGKVIGEDVSEYEELHKKIVSKYKEKYLPIIKTQTEFVLTLQFDLCDDKKAVAKALHDKVVADGSKLQTGFLGTPYILHVLSDNGFSELAYVLLLREEYPSWLYPITKGATTIWEHWDGIMPDGRLWSDQMNSFNHYAYGCVADWMYEVCGGINTVEDAPGFEKIEIKPIPTDRLDSFKAQIETRRGVVSSRWWHEDGKVKYEIITPTEAFAVINGETHKLAPGKYNF